MCKAQYKLGKQDNRNPLTGKTSTLKEETLSSYY